MKITKTKLKQIIQEELQKMTEEQPWGGNKGDESKTHPGKTDYEGGSSPGTGAEAVQGALPQLAASRLVKLLSRDKQLVSALEKLKGTQNAVKAQFLGFLATNLLGTDIKDIATASVSAQSAQAKKMGA